MKRRKTLAARIRSEKSAKGKMIMAVLAFRPEPWEADLMMLAWILGPASDLELARLDYTVVPFVRDLVHVGWPHREAWKLFFSFRLGLHTVRAVCRGQMPISKRRLARLYRVCSEQCAPADPVRARAALLVEDCLHGAKSKRDIDDWWEVANHLSKGQGFSTDALRKWLWNGSEIEDSQVQRIAREFGIPYKRNRPGRKKNADS